MLLRFSQYHPYIAYPTSVSPSYKPTDVPFPSYNDSAKENALLSINCCWSFATFKADTERQFFSVTSQM